MAIRSNNQRRFAVIIHLLPFMINTLLPTHPELHGIDEPPTLVTLVTTSFGVAAVGTGAFHKTVSKETLAAFTTQLLHRVFHEETVLVESPENILGYSVRIKDG